MKLEPIADTPAITLAPRDEKSRRRSNAAPSYQLPFTAEALESGVDLETLLALPVPVFTYGTQLTIHGILADFRPGLVSSYRHLTRNQNGSLGVRWGAIDAGKKKLLREAIRWLRIESENATPWMATQNCKGTSVSRTVETVAEGRAVIAALPTGIYGSAGLFRCKMSGTLWVDVEVGAIAIAALWSVISHFAPGITTEARITEIESAYIQRETAERKEREAAAAIERAERKRKHAAWRDILQSVANSHLRTWRDWKPAPCRFIRIVEGILEKPRIAIVTLEKRGPRLCKIRKDGKGQVVTDEMLCIYQHASAAGLLYHYDESAIPALTAAVQSLIDADAARNESPPEPQGASVTAQPLKVEAPTACALDLL